jgi:hypothetical protein
MSGLWLIEYDDEPDYIGDEWGEVVTEDKEDYFDREDDFDLEESLEEDVNLEENLEEDEENG